MKRFISHLFLSLTVAFATTLMPVAAVTAAADKPAPAPTNNCPNGSTSKGQVLTGIGETGSDCDAGGVARTIKVVVNILSFVAGVAAVIMIVFSGVKFVTSGGDSNAVSSAKNTLVYAIIGLVIAVLAQLIVHFVLNAIITGNTGIGTPAPPK
jgi:hypothetical protein